MTDTPPTEVPIEVLRESGRGTLLERMGIELTSATKDRVTGTMPVSGNTQPYGLLHGGASVVLAETLGSYAAMLNAGEGRIAVGVDINATHHRSLREGSCGASPPRCTWDGLRRASTSW
ncbi:hypothetical protein GCM10025862_13370 [Arsenicicoccus piscis]|uniref:Thioesterase domain-containing protein n=1 Tax=Arsenicicoccus piscis TaxID=673954 RepID=A0ABQ6HLG7_9MICO|nr:hypothetical protein GCM10025862_13370 [Arsenicicoccus piscis]